MSPAASEVWLIYRNSIDGLISQTSEAAGVEVADVPGSIGGLADQTVDRIPVDGKSQAKIAGEGMFRNQLERPDALWMQRRQPALTCAVSLFVGVRSAKSTACQEFQGCGSSWLEDERDA